MIKYMAMHPSVQSVVDLTKLSFILTRKLDASLNGISLSEFMILAQLEQAPDKKMRRIDLADKVGLTASGITRLLLPMEKIGLIKKDTDPRDARASYVQLASGGKQKLHEAFERAELLLADKFSATELKQLEKLSPTLSQLIKAL